MEGDTMSETNNNLLGILENIEANEQEQIFINKAIHQLKDEHLSEKIVVKSLVRDLRSIIINNQKLSKPALKLLNELHKPNLGFAQYYGTIGL